MGLTKLDFSKRGLRLVCQSGDTRFFAVPGNKLAYVTDLEIDTRNQSGIAAVIGIQIRDSYAPTGGTSTTAIRKEIGIKAGDNVTVGMEGEFQIFGGVDIRTTFSGPIVSLSAAFR